MTYSLDQIAESYLCRFGRRRDVEVAEPFNEPRESADTPSAGQNSREVLEVFSAQRGVYQGLLGKEAFSQGRGAPA